MVHRHENQKIAIVSRKEPFKILYRNLRVTPQDLFEMHALHYIPTANFVLFAPHPDGRFLVNQFADQNKPTINVITNLKSLLAEKEKSSQR